MSIAQLANELVNFATRIAVSDVLIKIYVSWLIINDISIRCTSLLVYLIEGLNTVRVSGAISKVRINEKTY
jgi:hypothetical protein